MRSSKLMKLIGGGMILLSLSFCVNASWESDACNIHASGGILIDQPYCVSSEVDHTGYIWAGLTNKLSRTLVDSYKTIIANYCINVLGDDKRNGRVYYAKPSNDEKYDKWDWQQTFDSKQSMFVYALCSSFTDQGETPFLTGESLNMGEIFQGEIVEVLKLQQNSNKYSKDMCSLSENPSLNGCDMSVYATEIFGSVMSEVFKISYAEGVGLDTTEDYEGKMKDRVTAFFSGHFNMTDSYEILQQKFPQTIDAFKSNQGFYKKVLDKLILIDNSKLVEKAEEIGCPETGDVVGIEFIACALHGTHGKGTALNRAFVTMYYNELLNYRVFIAYYSEMLSNMIKADNDQQSKSVKENELRDVQKYSSMQLEAAKQTLEDFSELNITYPLHIGLLMYQERAMYFREKFSPIVTIFYSLSEKLQNVQIPS